MKLYNLLKEVVMKKKHYKMKPRMKALLMLIFLSYFFIIIYRQEIKMKEQLGKIAHLEDEVEATDEMNVELQRLIDNAHSDEHIERIARERLGWIKEGEIIFIEKKN